ncbi:MAG: GDSL-type esterase/lipase family protein, partial [Flavobacteriales bacterium]
AGVLSHRLRQHFQHLSCDLDHERGLFFPFKLAKTNGPRHIKIDRIGDWTSTRCAHNRQYGNWGMTGIAAVTNKETCGMDLVAYKTDSVRYKFSSFKLFHDGEALPQICHPLPDSLYRNEDERLTEYFWNELQDSLSLRIYATDTTDCHIYGGMLQNDARGITYNAIGVNGASTKSYLRCSNMGSDLKHLDADLVIFGIGINDAYMSTDRFDEELFYTRYDSLASLFLEVNPNTKFIWLTNNDSYYKKRYVNKNVFKVSTQMNRLAEKYNGAVWDLFGVMGGLGSVKKWQSAGLAKSDKIHFTEAGYELSADLFFDAFRQAYTERIAKRMNQSIPLNP